MLRVGSPDGKGLAEFQIIDCDKLVQRLDHLRKMGVIVPKEYPPDNLDPSSQPFRGFLAELEVAELLAGVFPPELVEMVKPQGEQRKEDEGYSDADVIIHTDPPQYIQVKHWFQHDDEGRSFKVDAIVAKVRLMISEDIDSKCWCHLSTVSDVQVRLNDKGEPGLYGDTRIIKHRKFAHVVIIQVESEVLRNVVERKMKKSIEDAYAQLRDLSDGVIIPVINLSGFPHDQAGAYKRVKGLFESNPFWRRIGGVLLVTNDYDTDQNSPDYGKKNIRFIAVANPNAIEGRGLKESDFNPDLLDEDVFDETAVYISAAPDGVLVHVEKGYVYVNDERFARLPEGTTNPVLLRVKLSSRPEGPE